MKQVFRQTVVLRFLLCLIMGTALVLGSAGCSAIQPPETSTPSERPSYNTSTGFFVVGKTLYDAEGAEFLMRGVNANHWWNNGETVDMDSIPYIRLSGANTVRCVFGKRGSADEFEDPEGIRFTTAERRAVVAEYVRWHVVPVVEFHNATGSNDPAKIAEAVNFWIGENSWLSEFEKYAIVNISNEWCNMGTDGAGFDGSAELWRDTYIDAVAALRAAGIRNTLVIDSIQWGQVIIDASYYMAVFNSDPQKNIVFSFHMYDGWVTPGDPQYTDGLDYYHVDTGLDFLTTQLDAPVISGEFNHQAAPAGCPDDILLSQLESHGVGWLAWMWYNSSGHYQYIVYDSADSSMPYAVFGQTVVPFLARAQEATVFTTALPALPAAPPALSPDPDWNPGGLSIRMFDVSDDNPWWLQIEMDNVEETAGNINRVEMEPAGSTDRITLGTWGQNDGRQNFVSNTELHDYIAANVRFWLYCYDGSVARTEFNTLVQGNAFVIDATY
ncbi:MAG: hypothetical protein EHM28_02310 [Spirochaetaceae bacterium]|nr:MAG: hypothetical protein EHM28_02310 [Spirochaetaceae bacterium]